MLKFWNYLSVLAENKERFLAKTAVAPLAGAWIEIEDSICIEARSAHVAPLAGAWIEITRIMDQMMKKGVAPLAGAWIEIGSCRCGRRKHHVAPLAGAWIEITNTPSLSHSPKSSLPSRERGLKSSSLLLPYSRSSRSPRGSVD